MDRGGSDARDSSAQRAARSPLLEAHRFLRRGPVNAEGWSQLVAKNRDWERSYRGRWAHDKVVRSTHGVNCTGSCSWNVYVKDGLITWESQAVDYPSTGPRCLITSRAAALAGPRSRGTRTRRCG
jgi:nitrate reductase alpha subunit